MRRRSIAAVLLAAWRRGFTGWRIGDEIEVRDRDGNVVATTGHRYVIAGGFTDVAGTRVFFSCGGLDEQ